MKKVVDKCNSGGTNLFHPIMSYFHSMQHVTGINNYHTLKTIQVRNLEKGLICKYRNDLIPLYSAFGAFEILDTHFSSLLFWRAQTTTSLMHSTDCCFCSTLKFKCAFIVVLASPWQWAWIFCSSLSLIYREF